MSCMKRLVLSEPVVDIVDPNTALTNNCVIKVSVSQSYSKFLFFILKLKIHLIN